MVRRSVRHLLLHMGMWDRRIIKLADGEELISSEVDEHPKTLADDPRQESLEHRRAAQDADEASSDTSLRDVGGA